MTNIIGFNISWLGLIYFGNSFVPIAIVLLLIHVLFLTTNNGEPLLILAVCTIGALVDSILTSLNVLIFPAAYVIPVWLMTLWACFAATLIHSLRFFGYSFWLKVIAGWLAPLSYIAGERLHAVEFGQSVLTTYVILAVIWSGLFVLFFYLKTQLINEEHNHV